MYDFLYVFLHVCIYVYAYLSMYICVQMFDFDFSLYVYLSFQCWDSLFKLDIPFTCAGTPLDSHTEMVLILYLCAPHCKEGFVYIWFAKDFQELCEIALVAFGVSGNLTPFESEFKQIYIYCIEFLLIFLIQVGSH